MSDTLLFGPLSRDRYVAEDLDLPGGGALNMAFHWSRAGRPFRLLSRIGTDHAALFETFLSRHAIRAVDGLVVQGATASIDITIRADRQPWMDHFVEGVWADMRLTGHDERVVNAAHRLHCVMVDRVADELDRLGEADLLSGVAVSADLLDARHYTPDRLTRTLRHIELAFIGWPGDPADPFLMHARHAAEQARRLIVVTLGARGVLLLDARTGRLSERMIPTTPVEVQGTTIGCGDAFIAAFLHSWWTDGDLDRSVTAGALAGAHATQWLRPLPDSAYR